MAPKLQKLKPFEEPVLQPVNGIVQPPVKPPFRRRRRTNVLDLLRKMLNNIWKKTWAFIFHRPVDAKERGMADYHKVIKRPMDLGTIRKRLANNYYRQSDEAIADFRLVYENCLEFSETGTPFNKAGQSLKSCFNERLAKIDLTREWVVRRKSRKVKQKPERKVQPPSPPNKFFIKFRTDRFQKFETILPTVPDTPNMP